MKILKAICLTALVGMGSAQAAPLCPEFTSKESMPKKYRKLAPVLSAGPNDWIITADQMNTKYTPSEEAIELLEQIVGEFEKRGTKLAIMIAPPRPLVAGQSALDALYGDNTKFVLPEVTNSFNEMIDVLNKAGAIVPNLLNTALTVPGLQDEFYYRHDTHWTPRGAAESAVALGAAVSAAKIKAFEGLAPIKPNFETEETFSERGSLADMAKSVCGAKIAPIVTKIPVFPTPEIDLLGDTPERPKVLLAGSSFSNRYKKDAYRVADAISGVLQAEVINHSVSGGGAIGAIEGVLNAGLLDADERYDLVVWELPYTQGMRSTGMLRQLLGALQFETDKAASRIIPLESSGSTLIDISGSAPDILALSLPNSKLQRIKVDLRFQGGQKNTLTMTRKKHVPMELQSDWWALSLANLPVQNLKSITLRYDSQASSGKQKVLLY